MSQLSSKYNEKFTSKTLDNEYKQFLDKHEKAILIAFGTSFMPSREEMLKLIEVVQDPSFKNHGFILGLKKINTTTETYNDIEAMNIQNLMLREFVPQK